MSTLQPQFESTPLVALYHQALTTARAVNAEVRIVRSDGRRGWGDVNVINVDRDVIAIVATDITDVVESRAGPRSANAPVSRALIAGSSDLACVVDRSGDDHVHAAVGGVVPRVHERRARTAARAGGAGRSRRGGGLVRRGRVPRRPGTTARSVVLRFVARDGSVHTCDVTAENRSDEPAVGGIVLNVHDASALVAAEAQLAAVADAVSDVIVITDADGLMMWVSDAVRRELGLEPEAAHRHVGHRTSCIPTTSSPSPTATPSCVNETVAASPLNLRLRQRRRLVSLVRGHAAATGSPIRRSAAS